MRHLACVQTSRRNGSPIDHRTPGDAHSAGEVHPIAKRSAHDTLRGVGRSNRIRPALAVAVSLVIGLAVLASPVVAATVYVSPTGVDTNDGKSWATAKKTVTAGLTAAVSGDQIWVAAGTYVECITLKSGAALYGGFAGTETELTQRNWTTNVSILDGDKSGSVVTLSGTTANARLDGFTVRNGNGRVSGSDRYGGGIDCGQPLTSAVITNNTITGNNATFGGGIYSYSSGITISNNTITGNIGSNQGGGIMCWYSSPTIMNNRIMANAARRGGGIFCGYSTSLISNNTLTGNDASEAGGGINVIYCESATISNNIIAFNSTGVYGGGVPTFRNNCLHNPGGYNYHPSITPGATDIFVDPQLLAPEFGEVHLRAGSPCIDAGDDAAVQADSLDIDGQPREQGARVDIGADEFAGSQPPFVSRVIRVSPSGNDINDGSTWELAKRTVQSGIDAAARLGDGEVWVAQGTYSERVVLKPWIYLYGGFSGAEIDRAQRDWRSDTTTLDGGAGGTVVSLLCGYRVNGVDGFTITNGRASYGGAIFCSSCSPTICNNTIKGNTATSSGGSSGIYCVASSPAISGNTLTDNTGMGGGSIYCGANSSPSISNNRISGNTDAGIGCDAYSTPTISNNAITGNAYGGVSLYGSSSGILSHNVIAGNGRGGVACQGSATITNNTIVQNVALDGGGICVSGAGKAVISNNVIAFNSSGIWTSSSGTPAWGNNCVFNPDGYNYKNTNPGAGDMSVDPQLVAEDYGEVHLTAGSPCIDAGSDAAVRAGTVDMDGQPRIQGSHVDMGADEFDGIAPSYAPTIIRVSISGNDASDGSSWSSAKRTVQAGVDAASVHGGEIWVAAGTYLERVNLRAFTRLYGGFAGTESSRNERDWTRNASVLDGSKGGSVVRAVAGHHVNVVDGLVIQNGSGTEGAIYCDFSSPIVVNNTVSANDATGIYGTHSCSPTIMHNMVTGNRGAGIGCAGSAIVSHNTVNGNSGSGVLCSSDGVKPVISNNVVTGNSRNGIECTGSGAPVVVNNRIAANGGSSTVEGGGIRCTAGAATIANNTIIGNVASNAGGGIYCAGSMTILNNTVAGNVAGSGGGVWCNSGSPILANNIVAFNSSGIWVSAGTPALRSNCLFNPDGVNYYGVVAGTGDIVTDPGLLAMEYGEVHLAAGSPCIDAGFDGVVQTGFVDIDGEPRIQGTHVDIGSDEFNGTTPSFAPSTVRVSLDGNDANDGQSWASAKRTVQAGIDAASAAGGGEVWVAAGLYQERITLKAGTYTFGGFAGTESSRSERDWADRVTTLDGAAGGSVIVISTGGLKCGVDGFTIRNGTGTGASSSSRYGGGIYCTNSSPRISNNTITGNYAYYGGGISCSGACTAEITNNRIYGNVIVGINPSLDSGGGIYCSGTGCSPRISGNIITGNTAKSRGGGILCGGGSPTISNNLVTGNVAYTSGGAIYCSASAIISNNVLVANTAGQTGGGIDCRSSATITNNTIAGNSAESGGGIYSESSSPVISNNVVAWNSSGIHKVYDGTITLQNNCVFNPRGPNYFGLNAGVSDIATDPGLLALEQGSVHLKAGSPCIDTGLDAAVLSGWVDMDGEQRSQNGHVDIGADEFNGATPSLPTAVVVRVSTTGSDTNDGLSWATAKRTVQAGIDAAAATGGEVWVAGGTYYERITLRLWVYVYGGFLGTENSRDQRDFVSRRSVLDGSAGGSVVSAIAGSGMCGIDGFAIQNGTGTRFSDTRGGGGVYCFYAAPLISNNTITANMAGWGGGVFAYSSFVTISGNTITANSATKGGAIFCVDYTTPMILNNKIRQNKSSEPGAVYCYAGLHQTSPLIICNNTIAANVSSGICCNYYPVAISNNRITGNISGGLSVSAPSGSILNNTIVGNASGGGVYSASGTLTFANNIVAFNASGIRKTNGTLVLRNNCVYNPDGANYTGVTPGTGDISADPQLLAAGYGDLHLTAESPCIDAGDDSSVESDSLDMDGQPRIQGTHVDIGADEYDGTPPPPFEPTIIRVSPTGNDTNDGSSWALAKRTVQAGIDAASNSGGEVWVAAGTYSERITLRPCAYLFGGFTGTENEQSQRNWALNRTILDGQQGGSVVTVSAGYRQTGIDGFTIRGGKASSSGGGIYCGYAAPTIANNTFIGNITSGSGGAIYCLSSSTIIGNTITANNASSYGSAIYTNSARIQSNTIIGNGIGYAVYCTGSATLSSNIVAFNSSGIQKSAGTPVLQNNCVYNPDGVNYTGLQAGLGDISVDPLLVAARFGQVHLQTASPCIDAGDDTAVTPGQLDMDGEPRAQGAHVDIGVDEFNGAQPQSAPAIVRVSLVGNDGNDGSDWASAKRSVQAGINAAAAEGGEVWVAAGTYHERITLPPYASVYGGFAGTEDGRKDRNCGRQPTILDGDAGGSVVTILAGYRVSGLDGFIIRNGTGTLLSGRLCGGGIFCCASPILANNRIVGNIADDGGGFYASGSTALLINSVFVGNQARGFGGAVYSFSGTPLCSSCTFSANSAINGSAILNDSGKGTLVNCILWGNSDGPIYAMGSLTVSNSNIQGGWTGTGNINSDPRFVRSPTPGADNTWGTADDDYGDLRLQAGSPCVDAGNNAGVPADVLDLDGDGDVTEPIPFDLAGRARFLDDPNTPDTGAGTTPLVDMGAYEAWPVPGDFNYDGVVDGRDLDVFTACVTGAAMPYAAGLPAKCSLTPLTGGFITADFDRDGDVDQSDFGIFQKCFSGPNQPGDPNCAK